MNTWSLADLYRLKTCPRLMSCRFVRVSKVKAIGVYALPCIDTVDCLPEKFRSSPSIEIESGPDRLSIGGAVGRGQQH